MVTLQWLYLKLSLRVLIETRRESSAMVDWDRVVTKVGVSQKKEEEGFYGLRKSGDPETYTIKKKGLVRKKKRGRIYRGW